MKASTILRLPRVIKITGLSRSAIYELIAKGQFPAQVNLGPRTVGWVECEVVDWIESRIATRPNKYAVRSPAEKLAAI
jgi:prophage regulatory protein